MFEVSNYNKWPSLVKLEAKHLLYKAEVEINLAASSQEVTLKAEGYVKLGLKKSKIIGEALYSLKDSKNLWLQEAYIHIDGLKVHENSNREYVASLNKRNIIEPLLLIYLIGIKDKRDKYIVHINKKLRSIALDWSKEPVVIIYKDKNWAKISTSQGCTTIKISKINARVKLTVKP